MMPDPQKMAQVQQVTSKIDATIEVDYAKNSLALSMKSRDEEASNAIGGLLDQLATGLATQLQAFFAIKGEIIEIQ